MSDEPKESTAEGERLKVSSYDCASSWLLALLISVGLLVSVLVILWISTRPPRDEDRTVKLIGNNGGNRLPPGGSSQVDAIPDDSPDGKQLPPPSSSLESDNSLLHQAAETAAERDEADAAQRKTPGEGGGLNGKKDPGTGKGDRPGKPGPRPDETREVSSHSHAHPLKTRQWEVVFEGTTLDAYAKQLDYFQIELGVLQNGKISYASHLRKHKPDNRVEANPTEDERRYWLRWTQGDLRKADVELLSRAGIDAGDSFVLKFISPELEAKLVQLEKDRAGGDVDRVTKTRFGIRAVGKGCEFYVIDQKYKR